MKKTIRPLLMAGLMLVFTAAMCVGAFAFAANQAQVTPTEVASVTDPGMAQVSPDHYYEGIDFAEAPRLEGPVTVEMTEPEAITIDSSLPVDHLSDSDPGEKMTLKGTSVPTTVWNFGNGWYQGNIDFLKARTLYTNFSFQPSTAGKLVFQSTFTRTYSTNATLTVSLRRVSDKGLVSTGTYPTNFNGSTTATAMTWSGLNPYELYYFTIEPNWGLGENTVDGPFHVRQS